MWKIALKAMKLWYPVEKNQELLKNEEEIARNIKMLMNGFESKVDALSDDLKTVKAAVSYERLADIEYKLEAQDERYHRAYARTAETRLDNLERQNQRYCEREKELIERWKDHIADLQREVAELREENRQLKSAPFILDLDEKQKALLEAAINGQQETNPSA